MLQVHVRNDLILLQLDHAFARGDFRSTRGCVSV
jgi:hypothetical protein